MALGAAQRRAQEDSYPDKLAQVCDFSKLGRDELADIFKATEVGEVWGVGPRISEQLKLAGITTVYELTRLDPATVRARWSVVLERTVRELQGTPCIALEETAPDKKEIASTRSFGKSITGYLDLEEAITEFASRAAEKLRKQGSVAGQVLAFVRTSPFRKCEQYSRSMTIPLRRPTSDTRFIVQAALMALKEIYKPGYQLAKAGVMLMELVPDTVVQDELDLEPQDHDKGKLMSAVDNLNGRYGKGTVLVGSAGLDGDRRNWTMKQGRRTPAYTTSWKDMPIVRA